MPSTTFRRLGAACLALGFATAACTAGGADGSEPGPSATAEDAVPTGTASGWPGDAPDPTAAVNVMPAQRGDCPIDPADPGLITFVVSSGDDEAPVRVTYPVFRSDGQRMVRRMTSPGPIITVVLADCTGVDPAAVWGFRAATDAPVPLSCTAFVGGALLAADAARLPAHGGDGSSVDCSGHPLG